MARYLEHELGNLHGMTSRAISSRKEIRRAGGRVGDVVDVVRAVEVLSIPAATHTVRFRFSGVATGHLLTLGRER